MKLRPLIIVLSCCFASAVAATADACSVPVFRYALEHWQPDPYLAVIVYRGSLTAEEEALAAKLEQVAADEKNSSNLEVARYDVTKREDPLLAKAIGSEASAIEAPEIVLLYPLREAPAPRDDQSAPPFSGKSEKPEVAVPSKPAWRGPLTSDNIDALTNSPARRKLAKWILAGDSAVWVLLATGNSEADIAAEVKLQAELARLEDELKLADVEVIKSDEKFRPETTVALRLSFKVLVLDRNDEKEQVFASMLLNSEENLAEQTEPIAIPVYGRGRSYLALVGQDISARRIEANCRFLIGDCSCEVKRENPGIDLLFAIAWDDLIVGSSRSSQTLPELQGVGLYDDVSLGSGPNTPQNNAPPQVPRSGQITTDGIASTSDKVEIAAAPKQVAAPQAPEVIAKSEPTTPQDNTRESEPSTSIGSSEPFAQRLAFWMIGLIAIGAALVAASSLWLRRRASQQ